MVNTEIRLIILLAVKDGETLYSQQKQVWELTVAQILNSLWQNSDINWRKWGNLLDHLGMTCIKFYYSTVEVTDRVKGSDRRSAWWTMNIVQETGIWFRSYLNGLVVFPTFFNLCLNLAIRSSWSEPQSAPGLVFANCIELLLLWLQKI